MKILPLTGAALVGCLAGSSSWAADINITQSAHVNIKVEQFGSSFNHVGNYFRSGEKPEVDVIASTGTKADPITVNIQSRAAAGDIGLVDSYVLIKNSQFGNSANIKQNQSRQSEL